MGGVVWVASYPRSGNTWIRVFLHALLNVVAGREELDLNTLAEFSTWDIASQWYESLLGKPPDEVTKEAVAAARPMAQRRIADSVDGLVFVKTHAALVKDRGTPTIDMTRTAGAVYVVRNPLDVAISYARHLSMPVARSVYILNTPRFETDNFPKAVYEFYAGKIEDAADPTVATVQSKHAIDVALVWEGTFGNFRLRTTGGYQQAEADIVPANISTAADQNHWVVGGTLWWNGWCIGGNYAFTENTLGLKNVNNESYQFGAMYTYGKWSVRAEPGPAEEREYIVRQNRRRQIRFDAGVSDFLLTPSLKSELELLMTTLAPGATSGKQPYSHDGEEAGILMSGQLEIWIDGKNFLLGQGDSFAFKSTLPHRYQNPGTTEAVVIWAITPPSY
jgi:quercetin dioxygenase-like cupin family protein